MDGHQREVKFKILAFGSILSVASAVPPAVDSVGAMRGDPSNSISRGAHLNSSLPLQLLHFFPIDCLLIRLLQTITIAYHFGLHEARKTISLFG